MADQNNRIECRMIGGVCACTPGSCVVGLAATAFAAPAVPAVDALPRYEPHEQILGFMQDSGAGEYVRLGDVQALLATPSTAPADPEQAKLDSLARQPQAAPEVIAMLLDVVRAAWHAMDNTEENEHGHVWDKDEFDALSAAMDKLDALPDNRPGYVMGPAAKAEWAMRTAIQAAPEATSEQMGGAQVAKAVSDDLRTALDRLRVLLQMSTPSIDQIHEFGPDGKLEEAWQIYYDEVMPALNRAAEGPATSERKPLTDAEIFELAQQRGIESNSHALFGTGDVLSFGRSIEQHHGITGGGK